MIKILIVEDEKSISDLISINLTDAGFNCTCVYDGQKAAEIIDSETFDLILLDVMIPYVDGFELMEYIRPLMIPVIFITSKHEVKDKVKGLRLGAEDYIVKPFDTIELLARVETVLRRFSKTDKQTVIEEVLIDFEARTVTKNEKTINLTAKEFDLLNLFIKNKNIALFRDLIYKNVWGSEYYGDSRTVDLHVQRIRKKLGWEHCLLTVPKIGYRLVVKSTESR